MLPIIGIAQNILVEIFRNANKCHQIMYCFKVLQVIEKFPPKSKTFWKLICGMNMFNKEENTFYLNPYVNTKIKIYYEFQDTFIGLMAQWVTLCKDMYLNPYKIKKKENLINKRRSTVPLDYQYPHYLFSNDDLIRFMVNNKFSDDDLIIYTDGSYHHNWRDRCKIYEYGGIGIWLLHNNIEYIFIQPSENNYIM